MWLILLFLGVEKLLLVCGSSNGRGLEIKSAASRGQKGEVICLFIYFWRCLWSFLFLTCGYSLNWWVLGVGKLVIVCAYSNGRGPESMEDEVKKVKRVTEEKRRAELSARIASGEFTVEKPG